MSSLEARVRALFEAYGRASNAALKQPAKADTGTLADAFAPYFVGSSPAGVFGRPKDETFPEIVSTGFDNYRALGGTRFEIVAIEVEPLDDLHAMARIDWEFDYTRPKDGATGTIAFRNLYFVTVADGEPKIFAWITPDERKAMKEHGLV